jgi:hypothetical protein
MPQKRAHDVHLGVTGARVGAGPIDLLENDRRFRDTESAAAVLGRDERRQPARPRQRNDEILGICLLFLHSLPVGAVEPGAKLSNALSILGELARAWVDVGSHGRS